MQAIKILEDVKLISGQNWKEVQILFDELLSAREDDSLLLGDNFRYREEVPC